MSVGQISHDPVVMTKAVFLNGYSRLLLFQSMRSREKAEE